MKKWIVLMVVFLAATMVVSGSVSARDWKTVRIGTEGAYPPFNAIDKDGKLWGFDVDIAKAICDAVGLKYTFVVQDWDGIIPGLLAKKYDCIIASMSKTEERMKKVAFTDKYYFAGARFVARKGAGIKISKEGLKGKTVAVQRATVYDTFLRDKYAGIVKIKQYATQDEANLDLVSGRVDLGFAEPIALTEGFLKTDKGKDFELIGPMFSDPKAFGDGVCIAVRKGDNDLRELLNKGIKIVRENGTYKKINDKYFDFDIYGD
jgi:arginine/ornithine transport system substrate-binding protein